MKAEARLWDTRLRSWDLVLSAVESHRRLWSKGVQMNKATAILAVSMPALQGPPPMQAIHRVPEAAQLKLHTCHIHVKKLLVCSQDSAHE